MTDKHFALKVLHAACELKLFDILYDARKPLDVTSLAQKIDCPNSTEYVERFFNVCCSIGLLEKTVIGGVGKYTSFYFA